jgi:hypothetical protein
VKRGERIFKGLLARLQQGGVAVLHLTYASTMTRPVIVTFAKSHVPLATNVINLLRGRPFSAPTMEMNSYDLNRIFRMMQEIRCPAFLLNIQMMDTLASCYTFARRHRDSAVPSENDAH